VLAEVYVRLLQSQELLLGPAFQEVAVAPTLGTVWLLERQTRCDLQVLRRYQQSSSYCHTDAQRVLKNGTMSMPAA
jgi:hypothetical protein